MSEFAASILDSGQADGAGNAFRMFLIEEAARQREMEGHDVVRLTLGKSDLPLHDSIAQAIIAALRDPRTTNLVFPEGLPDLRQALSLFYRCSGKPVSLDRILIDAGTSSLYPVLFRLLLQPGDEVVLPMPFYPLYRVSALLARATIRFYSIDLGTGEIDRTSFLNALSGRTRIVVVNSPGNPLGNLVSPDEIRWMLAVLPARTYFFLDEIYENSRFDRGSRPNQALLESGQDNRFVITNAFSKAYRMYTRRIGWGLLPSQLARTMAVILHHTRLTVDPAVQFGALEALRHPEEVTSLTSIHQRRWNYAKAHLDHIDGTRVIESRGGFYFTLDCRDFLSDDRYADCYKLAVNILDRTGVAVVPGEDFGLMGTLRVSFTADRFTEAIDRLASYFKGR